MTWDDWTCVLGWPVQGVWKKFSDGTDVNSAHCCNKKKYLVTGDDYFKLNLYRYPCLKGAKHREYTGHCSHVMNVRFLRNDTRVVSAGGNDCSVFVWKHRYAVGSIVDGVELDEDDPEQLIVTTMEEIMAIEAAEIKDCFKGKEAEEQEDAMRREGLDADYDLDALKRAGRMAHGFDAGDGVNQEVGMAAHSSDPAAADFAAKEAARAQEIADATAAAPPPGGQMAKALFDHEPDEPDELPFKAGDMVKVTEKDEEGEWWTGEFDGKTGMFPASYVEVVLGAEGDVGPGGDLGPAHAAALEAAARAEKEAAEATAAKKTAAKEKREAEKAAAIAAGITKRYDDAAQNAPEAEVERLRKIKESADAKARKEQLEADDARRAAKKEEREAVAAAEEAAALANAADDGE